MFRQRSGEGRRRRLGLLLVLVLVACAGYAAGFWSATRLGAHEAWFAAARARAELASSLCVDRFTRQPGADAALRALMDSDWPQRAAAVSAGGWATMPDRAGPDAEVAALCAIRLGERYSALLRATPISAR